MTAFEEAREQKRKLWERYKQARESFLNTRNAEERHRQKDRVRILQAMYREACDEVRRLDPNCVQVKPKTTKTGAPMGRALDIVLQNGTLWADLEGESWSRLEGRSWADIDQMPARNAQVFGRMVIAALERCTPRQQDFIRAYYGDQTAIEDIADDHGVDKSTVSRVIRNGLARVERYVTAKLLLGKCIDGQGRFDYLLFVQITQVLTERQKEMVYFMLSQDTSYRDISSYIARAPSTVCRTVERMEARLAGLAVDLDLERSSVRIKREDWAGRTEKELAEELGLSASFYYRVIRRGVSVNGVPLLHLAVMRRLREGEKPKEAAAALGCSVRYVERLARQYKGAELPLDEVEPYSPRTTRRIRLPNNPMVLVSGGSAIMDRIDGATYRALLGRCRE